MKSCDLDISVDDAFKKNGESAFLIKLSNKFAEVNIYIAKSQLNSLNRIYANDADSIQAGESANSPVYWRNGNDNDVYILIGDDIESWDIAFIINHGIFREIVNNIDNIKSSTGFIK